MLFKPRFPVKNKKNNNDKITSASTNDGLIIPSNLDRDANKIDKNMLGAVVERIPRENIVPIYIGKKCMGYYYFEFLEDKNSTSSAIISKAYFLVPSLDSYDLV